MGGRIPPPWLNIPARDAVTRQNAKRARLRRKGLAPPGDKASLRQLADDAIAGRIPRKDQHGPPQDH